MNEQGFSHVDQDGRVSMVDVSAKETTRRLAQATCLVVTRSEKSLSGIHAGGLNLVASARLAGIQAAKRTAELIPLCHPLSLSHVRLDITDHPRGFEILSEVVTVGRTGVEMEALTACGFAALSLVNALLGSEPSAHLEDLVVVRKSGGKSGDWRRAVVDTA